MNAEAHTDIRQRLDELHSGTGLHPAQYARMRYDRECDIREWRALKAERAELEEQIAECDAVIALANLMEWLGPDRVLFKARQ